MTPSRKPSAPVRIAVLTAFTVACWAALLALAVTV